MEYFSTPQSFFVLPLVKSLLVPTHPPPQALATNDVISVPLALCSLECYINDIMTYVAF